MADLPHNLDELVAAAVDRHLARRAAAQPRRVHVFEQTFSGPHNTLNMAVDALTQAGYEVRRVDCPYADHAPPVDGETETDRRKRIKTEQRQAWIVAEQVHDDHPDTDQQATHLADAAAAIADHGYTLRAHGTTATHRPQGG